MESPSEVLCFFYEGQTPNCQNLKQLDFEEIKKVQEGIPLDWPKEIDKAKYDVSVKHISQLLKDGGFLNKTENNKEFNVILRLSVATKLFYKHAIPQSEVSFEKEGNVIRLGEKLNEHDKDIWRAYENDRTTQFIGKIAETQLIMLPSGEKIKVHDAKNLFMLFKRRCSFSDGTIINLFFSMEVDAVYEKGKDLIPMNLKLISKYSLVSKEKFARYMKQHIYKGYMSGGVTYLIGIQDKNSLTPSKINIVEDISSLCVSDHLEHFKLKQSELFLKLTQLNAKNGIIVKEVTHKKEDSDIKFSFKSGKSEPKLLLHSVFRYPLHPENNFALTEHELIILGSYKTPFTHNKFINTDFVKMDRFKKRFYKEIMIKPDRILFYGTIEEYAEILRYMSSEQLAITSRIVGSSG